MPWWNRPDSRLKKEGVNKLNPAELLSLILWSGKKGENAIDMSNRLLNKYSFGKLSDLSLTELEKEVDKIFIDTVLNTPGNMVGAVAYASPSPPGPPPTPAFCPRPLPSPPAPLPSDPFFLRPCIFSLPTHFRP